MNELETLISRLLDGSISDEERRELEQRLRDDPAAQRVYVEQCQLHAQLELNPDLKPQLEVIANGDTPGANSHASRSRNVAWLWGGVAVAASVVTGLAVWQIAPDDLAPVETDTVAAITPEVAYQEAEFSERGSLSRPPTNFAVVTPTGGIPEQISFNRDVRPIFSENCYHCHGPDANTRKAELRLDIEANAFRPHGEFEAAIIRGDPENSPVFKRITSTKKSEIMPPVDSHKTLTNDEKEIIRKWIAQGAEWEGHWAFVAPEQEAPPSSNWSDNAIDAFIVAEHDALGLAPNPEADRATLARRLSLDLIGLPPTPEQVAAFVADESPDAYERYVDKLLADPAYGEHQARFWLDAARYSDTHGLHLDNYREIWPYRDWVVQAFNENKPFDDFTVEQIAGDLLPEPSIEQLLATGFTRCNPTTSEGGAIDDEYRAIYAKDRAETAATVYMGLTVGCAACHDHKFDPISQKDFYQFSAFFNNIDGPIMDGNSYDTRPNLVLPRPEHKERWEQVRHDYEKWSDEFGRLKKERMDAFESWLALENPPLPSGRVSEHWSTDLPTSSGEDDRMQKIDPPSEINEWGRDSAFTLRVDYKFPKLEGDEEALVASKFDGERGWRLYALSGDTAQPLKYRLRFELISSLSKGEMISVTSRSKRYVGLGEGKKFALSVSYDGSGEAMGVQLGYSSRLPIEGSTVIDNLRGDFANTSPVTVALMPAAKPKSKPKAEAEVAENDGAEAAETPAPADAPPAPALAFFKGVAPLHMLGDDSKVADVRNRLSKPREDLSGFDKNKLKDYYFSAVDEETSFARDKMAEYEPTYRYIYDFATISLIMKEKEEEAMAHILNRGEYDQKGEEVPANVPEVLGGLPEGLPANRMGLAKWLVADDNPLTARVTVNRMWQNLFGIGLVATAEDFGIMGENPTHPELLDWLAVDFRDNGWDVKRMLKQIVMTKTYRQDAKIDPAEFEKDPENRFLARGPRYRLDAEVIRDQALFVSGALREDIGGPPVKPYQPSGIWNAVAYSGSNTRFYHEDTGDGLYRRSLYTFWKRTAPPPNMTIFDAPSRETCSVRRERTNTPLQALTLMNDPQYVEAARLLAERAMGPTGAIEQTPRNQIEAMYRFAFGHEAPDSHENVLHDSYLKFVEKFREDPDGAAALVRTGASEPSLTGDPIELASLTMVASQIMNLDSFISKN
ncbi:MAG: hypothetical protein SynsKO_13460 [Synoicihabitans sp.]